jgi:Glycosyl transferase family 11
LIIFSHKNGQLGNRLFAFAHLIANCAAQNHKIINLSFDEYARYFATTSQDVLCRYPATESILTSNRIRSVLFTFNRILLKLLRVSSFKSSFVHDVIVADLPEYQFNSGQYLQLETPSLQRLMNRKPFIFLFGRFFRDFQNFSKYQHILRNYFRPTFEIEQNVNRFLEKAKQEIDVLVGVHIRRGDYQQFANGKYFFDQMAYKNKMIELVKNEVSKKIRFVICSNEPINTAVFSQMDFLVGPGHLVEDMYIFASCDFVLGPPSTYTRWASFYGNVPLLQLDTLEKPMQFSAFEILANDKLFDF